MKKEVVTTPNAPGAIGPYSQAIRLGSLMFCSGQIPLDPKTGTIEGTTIQEQTHRVMKNIAGLLESQRMSWDHVVKSTVFLKNMDDFVAFNEVYGSYLKPPYPARSTVQVAKLPKDVLVEVETIALIPS